MQMNRATTKISASLTTLVATTPEFNFGDAAGAMIQIPSGSPITLLTIHTTTQIGDVYTPLKGIDGVSITQTVAAGFSYPLHPDAYAAAAFKLVSNADGSVNISHKS